MWICDIEFPLLEDRYTIPIAGFKPTEARVATYLNLVVRSTSKPPQLGQGKPLFWQHFFFLISACMFYVPYILCQYKDQTIRLAMFRKQIRVEDNIVIYFLACLTTKKMRKLLYDVTNRKSFYFIFLYVFLTPPPLPGVPLVWFCVCPFTPKVPPL